MCRTSPKRNYRPRQLAALLLAALLAACAGPAPPPQGTPTPDVVVILTAAPTRVPTPTGMPTPVPPPSRLPATGAPVALDGPRGKCWQAALGTVAALTSVTFPNADSGWAVGARGTILHTSDGGATWARQAVPDDVELRKVAFATWLTGWIAGPGNLLFRTTDGGATWTQKRLAAYETGTQVVDIAVADVRGLWALANRQPYVLHTHDYGATWQQESLPAHGRLTALAAVDRDHAWIADDGAVLRTTNGGATWLRLRADPDLVARGLFDLRDLAFVDAQNGWTITARALIAHTSDGGETWQIQHPQVDGVTSVDGLAFADASNGWALVDGDTAMHTTDGGVTWTAQRLAPAAGRAIAAMPGTGGAGVWIAGDWATAAAGEGGPRTTLIHTGDGGATWASRDAWIEQSPLETEARARLDEYLAEANPRTEALLAELLAGPCGFDGQEMIRLVLHNLGWDATRGWGDPLEAADPTFYTLPVNTHILLADLDTGGRDEIALDGTAEWVAGSALLYAGVIEWHDATRRWSTIWSEALTTESSAITRLQAADVNADGREELWWEYMIPRNLVWNSSRDWTAQVLRCEDALCDVIWKDAVGNEERNCDVAGSYGYDWSAGAVEQTTHAGRPAIQIRTYGLTLVPVSYRYGTTGPPVLAGVRQQVLRTLYVWDGIRYIKWSQSADMPAVTLALQPVTQTLGLSDGTALRGVFTWRADCSGLEQVLVVSLQDTGGNWRPLQRFAAAASGVPGTGVSLQQRAEDGRIEVVTCSAPSDLTPAGGVWPAVDPLCTVHDYDAATGQFVPQFAPRR